MLEELTIASYNRFFQGRKMSKTTPKIKISKPRPLYSYGEVFKNKYLGNKITEVLNSNKERVGFIWTTSEGRVIVSPHLGFYVWYGEGGEEWTMESASVWLVEKRQT